MDIQYPKNPTHLKIKVIITQNSAGRFIYRPKSQPGNSNQISRNSNKALPTNFQAGKIHKKGNQAVINGENEDGINQVQI